jgi:hypothetical protein
MIRDCDYYEEMTPHQLFSKIQQHESHALVANDQDSTKKGKDLKSKKVVEDLSDDESSSDEDTTMFIKTF